MPDYRAHFDFDIRFAIAKVGIAHFQLHAAAAHRLLGQRPTGEDAIDEIVAGVLVRSREKVAERHPVISELPFAVIAMGKCGARELNYVSDVDVIFVGGATSVGEDVVPESRAIDIASACEVLRNWDRRLNVASVGA